MDVEKPAKSNYFAVVIVVVVVEIMSLLRTKISQAYLSCLLGSFNSYRKIFFQLVIKYLNRHLAE